MNGQEFARAQAVEGQRLSGLFKQQFTFSLALTAAQRTVSSSPKEAVTYILSALTFIVACQLFRINSPIGSARSVLATAAGDVATQIFSSLLGTWVLGTVGSGAPADELVIAGALGLVLLSVLERSLSLS